MTGLGAALITVNKHLISESTLKATIKNTVTFVFDEYVCCQLWRLSQYRFTCIRWWFAATLPFFELLFGPSSWQLDHLVFHAQMPRQEFAAQLPLATLSTLDEAVVFDSFQKDGHHLGMDQAEKDINNSVKLTSCRNGLFLVQGLWKYRKIGREDLFSTRGLSAIFSNCTLYLNTYIPLTLFDNMNIKT